MAAPLYALLKHKAGFVWGAEQEEAFQRLKTTLLSKPCSGFPQDYRWQSITGRHRTFPKTRHSEQIIASGYFSKALSESQRKWSPTHAELFGIISALCFFRAIIYGNHTTIHSDH